MMRVILDSVEKTMNGIQVLDHISYEFVDGKIYGVVGKNGSGKTMLLRMISGLIKPTNGAIFVDEKQLWKDMDFPPELGILIEKPQFIDFLTGYENLKLIADIKGIVAKQEISDYMRLFSLEPNSKKMIKKYSLGMKQKIGIIQAIMEKPKLLILDEPFNALDAESVGVLREMIVELKKRGTIIVLTSHHKEDIFDLCDEILHIESGKLV